MTVQVDSREKSRAIGKILGEFDRRGVRWFVSKLPVGDYMSFDNPRLVVDRKHDLLEVVGDLTQQHARFRAEMERARDIGVSLVMLVEHGGGIRAIEDVERWQNPRLYRYIRENGIRPVNGSMEEGIREFVGAGGRKPPNGGEWLAKTMRTVSERYGVEWEFCKKDETGARILEVLERGRHK